MHEWRKRIRIAGFILQYYANAVAISGGTAWFGWQLLQSNRNVIDRVDLFPPHLDVWIGSVMILSAALKIAFLFHRKKKLKKYAMTAITLLWLVISWSYFQNAVPNTGYVMSTTITILCYVELWRGDYTG